MLDLGGSWEEHLLLVEFANNKSFQSSISMTPFEELYAMPIFDMWLEGDELLLVGSEMLQ